MAHDKLFTVYFDHHRPESEKPVDGHTGKDDTDYSPLRRVTGQTLGMGLLVSMGGMT
jgi:hypothetical protein